MPWIEMRFRGETPVFARSDAEGKPIARQGRVEIRYRRGDARTYRASEANLSPVAGATPFHDPVVDTLDLDPAAPGSGEAAPPAPEARKRAAPARRAASASGAAASKAKPAAVARPTGGSLVAYADGACTGNPGPAGLGVLLLDGSSQRELSEYLGPGTNNIAELTAILRVLEEVPAGRPLEIRTDSQYAIGVLSKGWKAKANVALVERIKAALRGRGVKLTYVPGHAGVAGNERADELAREAVATRASSGWLPGR